MKIVLYGNSELGRPGTLGIRVEAIARACSRDGSLVRVHCVNARRSEVPRVFVEESPGWFTYASLGLNAARKTLGLPIDAYRLRRHLFEQHHENVDGQVDVFHSWEPWPTALELARRSGARKIVLDVAMDIMIRPGQAELDYLMVPSKYLLSKAIESGYSESHVLYNPFGVDTAFYVPSQSPHNVGEKRYLFCGRLNERKGLRELLEAWRLADLPGAKLVLCGRSTPFSRELLKKQPLPNVEVKGYLGPRALLKEYQRAYSFVLPSRREGSAKVTYEALACGVPVIVTEEAGSVIQDGVEGLVIEAGNTDLLVEALRSLHGDEERQRAMGQRARETAERFSWDAYARRTMDHYRRIGEN